MKTFRKSTLIIEKDTKINPDSRVERFRDKQALLDPFENKLNKKFAKDGWFQNSTTGFVTPSGKFFLSPSRQGFSIEIEDNGDETSGPLLEAAFLQFMSDIGVPDRDILLPTKIIPSPGNRGEEFSDGVILFGNVAFLLQMKARNSTDENTYVSDDKYKRIKRNIEQGKIQFYRSLALARDSSNNLIEMESLSGEIRRIEIENYNWVSIVITHRNYFSNTDKPLLMNSKMNSPYDYGIPHVNHLVLTFQGIVNLYNLFPDYHTLLSYFTMLSSSPQNYMLCDEINHVFEVYGKFYGLEDNVLNFISGLVNIVNICYEMKTISKTEASELLSPIYSNDQFSLEELFVNLENNFKDGVAKLFLWDSKESNYYVLLDNSIRINALIEKKSYITKYGIPDNIRTFKNEQYSHVDKYFKISAIESVQDLNAISCYVKSSVANSLEVRKTIIDNFNILKGISAPQIISIEDLEDSGFPNKNVILMGDIAFIVQPIRTKIEKNYKNNIFSMEEDIENFEYEIESYSESFGRMIVRFEKMIAIKGKNQLGEIINFPALKYKWISLLVFEDENLFLNIANNEQIKKIMRSCMTKTPILFTSLNDLEFIVYKLEYNTIAYDFFRRISINNTQLEKFDMKELLINYLRVIGPRYETKIFISNFIDSVLNYFNSGYLSSEQIRKIFSIFDNLTDAELIKYFNIINSKIEKALKSADRYTFYFENSEVIIYFTVCNGLTVKNKRVQELAWELAQRLTEPSSKINIGILSDITTTKTGAKHTLVTHVHRNLLPSRRDRKMR